MGTEQHGDHVAYIRIDGEWKPLPGLQDVAVIEFDDECKQKVSKVRKVINFFKTFLKI